MRVFPLRGFLLRMKMQTRSPARLAATLVLALSSAGCVTIRPTPVASYDWQFAQLRDDATDKDKAFQICDSTAKRRARLVTAPLQQIYRYGALVQSCMQFEGWRLTKDPITIRYV
jgi:hypothetical protein